ncbi:hypothetical protein [uncultured Cyclobacterium sp.]|uniref:hypothetical protein n=1 Tax=uncultured Cyclobacterium sp. TaxID=453820 RepID=UPI0030ECB410|tara:strand:- start:72700 stop:74016 length:1317 start_codon:yes stop_codon:yes gene_type:complete
MRTEAKILKWFKYLFLGSMVLILLLVLVKISPALWNRWVTYPQLEKARNELWEKYRKPPQVISMPLYQGAVHSHTFWSHDSRGLLPEIMDGAKKAELQFIFNSDHKRNQLDTFPRGYQGIYEGIIIESGTEHNSGLMVSPFDSTVIDWDRPESEIIREIVESDGLAIYVHSEDEHDWGNQDYQAMEIYNIHTDMKDEKGIFPILLNRLLNPKKYTHWMFRDLYDEQTEILTNWDRLNQNRKIVGVAGVDAHNNQSFRARHLEDEKIEWVGPNADTLVIREANWFDKLLMGEADKYGWAFKWELDPYFNSYNHANNYVYCDTFTNVNIRDHIKLGHLFVSFESLAKGDGFQYFAVNDADSLTAILGDSVNLAAANKLKVLSPFPVKFQLYQNGELIEETEENYEYEYLIRDKGNYRIVARIDLRKEWTPWIYTNPIYVY